MSIKKTFNLEDQYRLIKECLMCAETIKFKAIIWRF